MSADQLNLESLIVGTDGYFDMDAVYKYMNNNPLTNENVVVLNKAPSKRFVHVSHDCVGGGILYHAIQSSTNENSSLYLISSTNPQVKKDIWIENNAKYIEWQKKRDELIFLLCKGAQFRKLGEDMTAIIVDWVFGTINHAPKHCRIDIDKFNSKQFKYIGFNRERQMAVCHPCIIYLNNCGWYLHEVTSNIVDNHVCSKGHSQSIAFWQREKAISFKKKKHNEAKSSREKPQIN